MSKVLSIEDLNRNLSFFIKGLDAVGVDTNRLIDLFISEIKVCPLFENDIYGYCYPGGLLDFNFKMVKFAKKISELFSDDLRPNPNEITKVGLLANIGKIELYTPTKEQWKKQRGIFFDFKENSEALRAGQRTVFILQQAGIELNKNEYETLLNFDSLKDDAFIAINQSVLSGIMQQAYNMVLLEGRLTKDNVKNENSF